MSGESWREDALWAITKSDVDCVAEGRNLTNEQKERVYHQVEGMDASSMMEQVADLIDWVLAEDKEKNLVEEGFDQTLGCSLGRSQDE